MITESKHITNCYRSISQFFDAFGLLYARKYIQKSLLAAGGNTIWKGKCPADLVHFYEQFQLLLEALSEIAACGCIRRNAVIESVDEKQLPDMHESSLFCPRFHEAESWHYLPRYLSAGEFFNPYKALKKAIQHIDDTEEVLHTILHYALSNESFAEAGEELDTLELNIILQKLLEAAHLLYVRTVITSNETTSK